MRIIVIIIVALWAFLLSGCSTETGGEAATVLAPVLMAQPPAVTPTASPTPVALSSGSMPVTPPALSPTSTNELPPTPMLAETNVTIDVQALIDVASIHLRTGPGLSYSVAQTVRAGERYQVTGKSSAEIWFRLAVTGGEGWIPARYIVMQGEVGLVPVVADDLGSHPALGQTPLPKATNTPSVPSPTPRPVRVVPTGESVRSTPVPAPRSAQTPVLPPPTSELIVPDHVPRFDPSGARE